MLEYYTEGPPKWRKDIHIIFAMSHVFQSDDHCQTLKHVTRMLGDYDGATVSNNYWLVMRMQQISTKASLFNSALMQDQQSLMLGIFMRFIDNELSKDPSQVDLHLLENLMTNKFDGVD